MDIHLTPAQQQFIHSQIGEGAFASEQEVIIEALRRMMETPPTLKLQGWTMEAMEAEIQKGLDDFAAGRVVTGEQLEKEIAARRAKHSGNNGS